MALTPEQRKLRRAGLGGSDAAAILGLSKWKTPLEVYLDKVLGSPDDDKEESQFIEWGNRLEPLIIKAFEDKTGLKCELEPAMLRHPKYPHMLANIDARIVGHNAILECKTASQYKAKEWSMEGGTALPETYMLQCAHYAEVCDVDIVYVSVLIGGNDFRIYHYVRDKNLGQAIINAEYKFWHEHVLKQIPPSPINLEDSIKLWEQNSSDDAAIATAEIVDTIAGIRVLRNQSKEIDNMIKQRQMSVYAAMQNAGVLNDEYGNTLATWKTQTTNRFDSGAFKAENPELYKKYLKESNSRVFKLKGEKE